MPNRSALMMMFLLILPPAVVPAPVHAGGALPDNDILTRALVDELARSMKELKLEDLPRPYFIQFNAEDQLTFTMETSYGGLLSCDENRSRTLSSRVRIGSYQLDNTNFLRSYGGRARFAIDDDYVALRHAIWLLTDGDYKRAVEALARKEAFLKEKTVVDRPDDLSPAELAVAVEPSPELAFDRNQWEENLKRLSARFSQHTEIQDSGVSLYAVAVNEWVVNSEEARVRTGDTGIYVEVDAEIQAPDGMLLTDHRTYIGEQFDQLPPIEKMLADVDEMCRGLVLLSNASVLEHYDGPVLFEPPAAGRMFHALLADGLCARPIPLGAGGWGDESLEKKIGRRILPRSFQVVDDPGPEWFEGTILAGAYTYDDEGVRATRISLVENGILETLLASRAPTRKIKHTTGHGMNRGYGDAQAHIGCLYISDDKAVTSGELTEALIQAARDEGLDFGLRVVSIEEGGHGALGDPIYAYKVYVEDGREELVRGVEFLPLERRALKHILAAGEDRKVYNSTSGLTSSVISPAVLFEEVELTKIEEELDKLPILKSPATRGVVD